MGSESFVPGLYVLQRFGQFTVAEAIDRSSFWLSSKPGEQLAFYFPGVANPTSLVDVLANYTIIGRLQDLLGLASPDPPAPST